MLGCGGVGLQVVAAARIAGADPIIAVDRVAAKLELAAAQGATHLVDASEDEKPVSTIRRLTGGGADYAFEVIGRPETIRLAWGAIRPGGTAVVVGLAPQGVEASVPAIEFLSDKSLARHLLRLRRPGGGAARARARSPSRASSTSRASSPTSTRSTASRPRSTGSAAARARVPSW